MKKAAFVCAGLISFSPFISAFPRAEFRALGDFQFSHISVASPELPASPKYSPRLGYCLGVGFCFPFSQRFSIESDILYKSKKSELTRFSGIEWNDTYYRMQCVTIPLLAHIGFPVSKIQFFVAFGIQGDWIFMSRIEDKKNDVRIEPTPGLKPCDLQAVGGVGIRYKKISIEFTYEYGLFNLSKDRGGDLVL